MTRLVLVAAALLPVACTHATLGPPGTPPPNRGTALETPAAGTGSLKAFESLQQLRELMASVAGSRRIAQEKELARWRAQCRESARSDAEARACATMEWLSETVTVSGGTVGSVTNNQHAGLDEGDIVKRQGDVLIVLRRGRLFTIGIGSGQLHALAVADAFGPAADGVGAEGTWYDELLVWQRTILVIGYSYERGGAEIGLFDLGDNGELQHRATYHVRSDDYYSTRNYASRLIGDRLILFSSLRLPENVDPHGWLPALRRWDPRNSSRSFETITSISRVFQPVAPLGERATIHTLTICDLAAPSFECEATVVLGDPLTTYYASPTAAYAWTTAWDDDGLVRSILYRMPFDGAPVSAAAVAGYPPDQLAFYEDAHQYLNVVTHQYDVVALLRLPPSSFSDGSIAAPPWYYRPIARGEAVIARFVGSYVLVGTPGPDADAKAGRRVVVTAWAGTSTVSLKLPHTVERIEAMGAHAVVVGTDHDSLLMTAIRLEDRPAVAGSFVHPEASQSEYRSHAFFYRQDGLDDGMFGLPIASRTKSDNQDRWDQPARILFIRNRGLTFFTAGTLDSLPPATIDDGCRASCIDWYGNARPIFIEDRILALSGYEITEGRLTGGNVESIGRLDFMPRPVRAPQP